MVKPGTYIAGLKYLTLMSEISSLNFININAYEFG